MMVMELVSRWLILALCVSCLLLPLVSPETSCDKRSQNCIRLGERFSRKYLRSLRVQEGENPDSADNKVNVCRDSNKFRNCVRRLEEGCHNNTGEFSSVYGVTNHTLTGLCGKERSGAIYEEAKKQVDCFEAEYESIFWQYCDDFTKFNLAQIPKASPDEKYLQCYYKQEGEDCSQRLLSSWCTNDTLRLAEELTRTEEIHSTKEPDCHGKVKHEFSGFTYSEGDCASGLDEKLMLCEDNHLLSGMIKFHKNNDLIAQKAGTVKKHCREYKQYRKCVRKYRSSCPLALDMFYAYDGELRTYLHKMHYICSKQFTEYTDNLPCLQRVVQNGTVPNRCEPIWQQVSPLIQSVPSRDFYCHRHKNTSRALHHGLNQLRACYTSQYNDTCGPTAATIMDDMTKKAFSDPYYLHYDFKPDCNSPPAQTIDIYTGDKPSRETGKEFKSDKNNQPDGQSQLANTSHGPIFATQPPGGEVRAKTEYQTPKNTGISNSAASVDYYYTIITVAFVIVRQTRLVSR